MLTAPSHSLTNIKHNIGEALPGVETSPNLVIDEALQIITFLRAPVVVVVAGRYYGQIFFTTSHRGRDKTKSDENSPCREFGRQKLPDDSKDFAATGI